MGELFREAGKKSISCLRSLPEGVSRLQKLEKSSKNHIVLSFIILVLAMGVFFKLFSQPWAYAKAVENGAKISKEALDPLNRVGKGIKLSEKRSASVAYAGETDSDRKEIEKEEKILRLVVGHPIEQMAPFIAKRDDKVSSYLVAIAKKESDWGKHTPKKHGRECYNYWGYRGKENTTESGYSCFDSPEHAIKVVGDRIEKLINKKVDTPAKMVVWKCGGDCEAAGGQAAANKWIADVAGVYKKLN